MRSLTLKVLLILLGIFVLSGVVNYQILRRSISPNFTELERREAHLGINRILSAIERELYHLKTLSADWASWDDTYNYVKGNNPGFAEVNLVPYTFIGNKLDLLSIIHLDGTYLWSGSFDQDKGIIHPLPAPIENALPLDHPLIAGISGSPNPTTAEVLGIQMIGGTPMLVATHPILTSNHEGPPQGFLVMGRFFDDNAARDLREQLKLNFRLIPGAPPESRGFNIAAPLAGTTGLSNQTIICEATAEEEMILTAKVPDLLGDTAFLLELYHPMEIVEKGMHAIDVAGATFLGSWYAIIMVLLLLLHHTLLGPIRKLTKHALHLRKSGDLSARINFNRRDEIGTLGMEVDRLVAILEQHTGEQEQINRSLREIDRMRNEFISSAAHELNTPLASIMGYTEFLVHPETFGTFSDEQKSEFAQEIYSACLSLERVIKDILDISRFESGQKIPLEIRPCPLQMLINRVVRRFRIQSTGHELIVNAASTPPALVDEQRILQVLENLVSNAIKYSPDGGTVTISLSQADGHLRISVRDQGIGMNAEQRSRIFDKFYRADASNTAISGLGLGMSIVKQIVEAHEGSIWVDSTPGVGSILTVELPITGPQN